MILLKKLLLEAGVESSLTPKDIYNFYFIEYISRALPQVLTSNFGQEVVNYYLSTIKSKYLNLFKTVAYQQLEKYIKLNRIDKAFDKSKADKNLSLSDLHTLMQQTYRTDMSRKNINWNYVTEHLLSLSETNSVKGIIMEINALNMAIHNSGAAIIKDSNKIINAAQLIVAFNTVDRIKNDGQWTLISKYLDKDVRNLADL